MAAAIAPTRASAEHQSLLHFVGQSRWSDEAVLAKVRELVLPAIESNGPIEAWIVDDTGFPKKGVHSVGVARQYCGRLGKQDNCQVAVSLSVANHTASLPIAYQLYLPEEWVGGPGPTRTGPCAGEYGFRDEAGDRAQADQDRARSRASRRRRAGGCGLWRRCEVSLWPYRARSRLCRRRAVHAERLASRDGALAATLGRPRADADAIAPG